jgi:hypothetical protein
MSKHSELLCEGQFPMLPSLARSLMLMSQALLKKLAEEIDAVEHAITNGEGPDLFATSQKCEGGPRFARRARLADLGRSSGFKSCLHESGESDSPLQEARSAGH